MKIVERKIENVSFISLDNENGMFLTLSTNGAGIYQLEVVDANNKRESVVLTPQDLNDYYTAGGYFGKCVGRFSGRIDEGKCKINDVEYNLDINWNGVNSIHGGFNGIHLKTLIMK